MFLCEKARIRIQIGSWTQIQIGTNFRIRIHNTWFPCSLSPQQNYVQSYHHRGSVEQLPGYDGQLLGVELLQLLVQLLCFPVLLLQLFNMLLFHPLKVLLLLQVLCKLLCVDLKKERKNLSNLPKLTLTRILKLILENIWYS